MTALRLLAVLCAGAVVLTACTSGTRSSPPSSAAPTPRSSTSTSTSGGPPVIGPVNQGTIRERTATSCPLMTRNFVQNTVGMRLDRITELRNDAGIIGCRFYPLSHPNGQCDATCLSKEHLPGPSQPSVEVTTTRYPSAAAAHNAFVRIADKGTNPQRLPLTSSITSVCFQTDFYPKDKGEDWACGFTKDRTAVLVRTVVTSPALNAFLVTKKALSAL